MLIIIVMSKRISKISKFFAIILLAAILLVSPEKFLAKAYTEDGLYLGGFTAGFTITNKGTEVLGLSEVVTEDGVVSPAKEGGIMQGDVIVRIGNKETNGYDDLEGILNGCNGEKLSLTIERNGEISVKEITPVKDLSGKYKLGLFLRDKMTGIGTVTFVKKDGGFMALGHPVCGENGKTIEISGGELFACSIFGIERGVRGKAGELRGSFFSDQKIGDIKENTEVGISGKLNDDFDYKSLTKIDVGEGHIGNATIFTTVEGTAPKEFSISIIKVDKNEKENRNYVIKVTDKTLLSVAGGIVQGMSGSPIIQDGKIVGAVTHVFLNDPTRGFGISIENMLSN